MAAFNGMFSCPLCDQLARPDSPFQVVRFASSTLLVGDHQFYPGYCVLVLNRHVRDMVDLEPAAQAEVLAELMKAAMAVQRAYEPFKLNYACFGNQVPHIHWHIFPRFSGETNLTDQPFSASGDFPAFRTTPQQAAEVADRLRRAL